MLEIKEVIVTKHNVKIELENGRCISLSPHEHQLFMSFGNTEGLETVEPKKTAANLCEIHFIPD